MCCGPDPQDIQQGSPLHRPRVQQRLRHDYAVQLQRCELDVNVVPLEGGKNGMSSEVSRVITQAMQNDGVDMASFVAKSNMS